MDDISTANRAKVYFGNAILAHFVVTAGSTDVLTLFFQANDTALGYGWATDLFAFSQVLSYLF